MFVSLSEQGTNEVAQGSGEWFKRRKHKMTGSKPSSIMFECKDEASYHKMWDIVFGETPPEPFDERQQAAVDWGKQMEDVACERFYKSLPGCIVYETSIIDHPVYDWIAASPDGYVVRLETDEHNMPKKPYKVIERAALEIKCPGSNLRDGNNVPMPSEMAKSLKKKKNPPYYYMTQLHFEMVALGTPITYFYMWTPWYSKLWKVHFDHQYWEETMAVLSAFKHKQLPWEVLKSKLQSWKNISQSIARKYTAIQEWNHAPKETILPIETIRIHSWYSDEEKKILKMLYPNM